MRARKRQQSRTEPWVGPWLRKQRIGRGVDMETVAKRLKRSPSAVSRLETGDSSAASDDLPAILRAYSVSIDEFAAAAKTA
jgi:transcriptional regulator with XRE-family HTH domain